MRENEEYGFVQFTTAEIDTGMDYGYNLGIRLDRFVLAELGNHAGAIRLKNRGTPREAAAAAIHEYERKRPGRPRFRPLKFEGYVKAIAKMMSERSPKTAAKRERDAHEADRAAASEGISKYEQESRGW